MNFRTIAKTSQDSSAMGKQVYYHGETYNGVALTVTGVSSDAKALTVVRAWFIPFAMLNGAWFMHLVIVGTSNSAVNMTATIPGILFKNVTNFRQPVMSTFLAYGYANPNANTIFQDTISNAQTLWHMGGLFELNAKPTWAF